MARKISGYQFVLNVTRKHSSHNQEYYWQIDFLDDDGETIRKTYVSEDNNNHARWRQLIDYVIQNPDQVVCVSGNFSTVPRKPTIINADARIEFEHAIPKLEFQDVYF